MLRLRIYTDALRRRQPKLPSIDLALLLHTSHQRKDLLERRNLKLPIEARVVRPDVRNPLPSTQRLQLGECEVFSEPPGVCNAVDCLRGATTGELGMPGDICRALDLDL